MGNKEEELAAGRCTSARVSTIDAIADFRRADALLSVGAQMAYRSRAGRVHSHVPIQIA